MADLKPCPFCGQPVDYTHTAGSYGYYPATIAVGCKPCGYKLPAQPLEEWAPRRGHYDTTLKATETVTATWNRRSAEDE